MEKVSRQNLHRLAQYTADFIKCKTGKGPRDIKSHLLENKVIIEMSKLLTPIELEIASTTDGVFSVKAARERFYEKYTHKYHTTAGEILNCRIKHSSIVWDVPHDEAYIILSIEHHGVENS